MSAAPERLHLGGLLALGTAGFVTILTEALPAGVLPQIGHALDVSEALAGQWVSVYALGSLAAAIPLTAATRSWRRRPLLLAAILGFALANGVTAATGSFAVSLIARFVGGVSAGLLWALLAGYAVRLAPKRLAGRAMAIAMAGTPVALSIGIPIGTILGTLAGWRIAFATLSVIAMILAGWMALRLPDAPGEAPTHRPTLRTVFALPGVRPVLLLTLCFVLAHNILYTFITPLLAKVGMAGQTDRVLLVFGVAGLASIVVTGMLIDRHLRTLTWAEIALFACGAILLGICVSPVAVYTAALALGPRVRGRRHGLPDRVGQSSRRRGGCRASHDRDGLEPSHRRRCDLGWGLARSVWGIEPALDRARCPRRCWNNDSREASGLWRQVILIAKPSRSSRPASGDQVQSFQNQPANVC